MATFKLTHSSRLTAASLVAYFLICASGCTKVTGNYSYIDFRDNADIRAVTEGNVGLRGLVGDHPFPLASELSDSDIVLRFEVNAASYAASTKIVAMDSLGNPLSISPIESRGPCHFFRPVNPDDDSTVEYVWTGCNDKEQVARNRQIEFIVGDGLRRFEIPFQITSNGRWSVYDTL
jgi:hypothetical protein